MLIPTVPATIIRHPAGPEGNSYSVPVLARVEQQYSGTQYSVTQELSGAADVLRIPEQLGTGVTEYCA